MAKQIKQYRYFGENDPRNYPSGISKITLYTGTIFETQIIDLRIQSYPGTKFYLNGSDDYIMTGASGEYHLGLAGNYEITSLRFDKSFLESYFTDNGDSNAYLIVDIIYNTTEE